MEHRRLPNPGELPGRDVPEVIIVAKCLAVGGLALFAEMPPAGFAPVQRIKRQELGKLEVVGDPAGVFEALIEVVVAAGHRDVVPELLAELWNRVERAQKAL